MRIAFFHELDFGGARRTVYEVGKRLNKKHIVDLYYVCEINDEKAKSWFHSVYYYNFIPKPWEGGNWKIRLYKDTVELIKLYNLHKKIAKDIKEKKYDYVFVHPSKFTQAPFLLRFLKNKCIYFCQEPLRIVYDPYLSNIAHIKFPKNIYELINRKIRKWVDLRNLKSALIILANSNFSKEFIQKTYDRSAEVCYLGVDTNFFKPLNINKSIDILFIGNKDESYKLLKESLKFFPTKPKIYTIFRENRKITISDKKLAVIYNKSEVLVALNRNEPLGLIPLEAMACGVPVVAVKEGGYQESIIDGKTGFLVKRDPKSVYSAIKKLINDPILIKKMGENAREHVLSNWTWDKSVSNLLDVIEKCLKR